MRRRSVVLPQHVLLVQPDSRRVREGVDLRQAAAAGAADAATDTVVMSGQSDADRIASERTRSAERCAQLDRPDRLRCVVVFTRQVVVHIVHAAHRFASRHFG